MVLRDWCSSATGQGATPTTHAMQTHMEQVNDGSKFWKSTVSARTKTPVQSGGVSSMTQIFGVSVQRVSRGLPNTTVWPASFTADIQATGPHTSVNSKLMTSSCPLSPGSQHTAALDPTRRSRSPDVLVCLCKRSGLSPLETNPYNRYASLPHRQDACRNTFFPKEVKHLGQLITFMDRGTTEAQHRVRCAWSAFARHRQD